MTWKFWRKNYVHINIMEGERLPGQAISSHLQISGDHFENLREIVERYIIPCNRLVRDVTQSGKWSDVDSWEDLQQSLLSEKGGDKSRIPYKFAILPQYP